jgi:crotonobetainyl-CoA:carnitine CoA-transferase CaiB-like acyl-CoA transferase
MLKGIEPMNDALAGIRVIEVAAWTFVPSSGGVMAEWGADVIKIEDPVRGDPQRGLAKSGLMAEGAVDFMVELPNRGKRSVAIDISTDDGRELLFRLIETADVFITSFLPAVRQRLGIDVEQVRARNPQIIYVRGSAHGPRGEETDRGGFDGATFWSRSGISWVLSERDAPYPVSVRPAFGDMISGAILAGGVAAALLKRERTGAPSEVDVSLLGTGLWALSADVTSAKLLEHTALHSYDRDSSPNPLTGTYQTKDDRFINFLVLQADRYWGDFCEHIDRVDLVTDPRFKDAAARYENRRECIALLRAVFRTRTFDEWRERLKTFPAVWAPVNTPLEVHDDPQVEANQYLVEMTTGDGVTFKLPGNPVQFDMTAPHVSGAPAHGEHTDAVLLEMGLSYDEIIAQKVSGAIL